MLQPVRRGKGNGVRDDLPDGWADAPGGLPGEAAEGAGAVPRAAAGEAVRGRLLAETLVGLADTLDDAEEPEGALRRLAGRSVRLLGVAAAGVLLADERGQPRVVGASGEPARLLAGAGPGAECCRTGREVHARELGRGGAGLPPDFVRGALRAGYRSVFAVPLRHGEEVVGALVLFRAAPGPLPADAAEPARSLADAAAIGVLQRRARRRHALRAAQLQTALDSRVPVEQAKGLLAERFHVSVDDAFALLRAHARSHRLRVADLAAGLLDGTATLPGP